MRTIKYVKYLELGLICLVSSQLVKNPPAVQETLVRFLGREDPLEKGKATHPSILAWRMPSLWGRKESDTTERLFLTLSCSYWGFPGGSDGKESPCN